MAFQKGDIRTCKLCGCEFEHFGPRAGWCRPCYNSKAKESRQNRNPEQAANAKRVKMEDRVKKAQHVFDYLKEHPCACGERRVPTLQFDHRDQTEKDMQVSAMPNQGYSIKRIDEEIAKCDVRCANCHAVRTSIQCEWYINQDQEWVHEL